jgi:hypothetical protein
LPQTGPSFFGKEPQKVDRQLNRRTSS